LRSASSRAPGEGGRTVGVVTPASAPAGGLVLAALALAGVIALVGVTTLATGVAAAAAAAGPRRAISAAAGDSPGWVEHSLAPGSMSRQPARASMSEGLKRR